MSVHVKCLSLEKDGHYYGVVLNFDGFPIHRTEAHASRTAARISAEDFATNELGKEPFHRIRIGSSIANLKAYLAQTIAN